MTTRCISNDIHSGEAAVSLRLAPGNWLAVINTWWLNRRRRSIDRLAIKHLLTLDEALLRDIGVTRADVESVRKLPSSVDATVQLEIIARGGGRRRR